MEKKIVLIVRCIFYGFIIGALWGMNNNLKRLQDTLDSLKPVDDCAWLEPDRRRGAVIYNRFDNTITIQCKGSDKL